jgi:hypothetical protein
MVPLTLHLSVGRYCPPSFLTLFDLCENDWLEFTNPSLLLAIIS